MPYVCRSCLLRLGQPWHLAYPTRPLRPSRPSPSPLLRLYRLPYQPGRHGAAFSTGRGGARAAPSPQQDGEGSASMMYDGALDDPFAPPAQQLPVHDPFDFGDDSAPDLDVESPQSLGYNYEKVAVDGPAALTARFAADDKRVQFIREVQRIPKNSWHMATILRRFAETEQFQEERLAQITKRGGRVAVLGYRAWKQVIKQLPGEPITDYTSLPPVIQTQIQWLQECNNADDVMAGIGRFRGLFGSHRYQRDLQLITVALRYVPDKLHPLFTAILRNWDPPAMQEFYVFEDVVGMLALRLEGMEESERGAYAEDVAALVLHIVENARRHYVQMPQAALFRILRALPSTSVAEWYQRLCAAECNIHMFTHLHFAARMARFPTTKELSAQVLRNLKDAGMLSINSPVAASVCTSILSFTKDDMVALDGAAATPADLFSSLHGIGLVPNVITYSAIMRGLCLKGDLRTALDVFEVMQSHGVAPDAFAFSILLHGCKMANDFEAFTSIALQAYAANVRDPVVWNDVLHAVYLACLRERKDRRGPRRTALFALNSIYTRIFDPGPIRPFVTKRLIEIGDFSTLQSWFPDTMRRLAAEIPPIPPQEVVQPGSDTVAIMILGLIRYLPLPYDVVMFYTQFRQMLAEGHPVAERMVREKGTFVHDIVLRNLFKWKGTMRIALDIIGDMMRDVGHTSTSSNETGHHHKDGDKIQPTEHQEIPPQDNTTTSTAEAHHDRPPKPDNPHHANEHEHNHHPAARQPIRHPAPSVYTWSILIQGFMRHNQPRQAERVLSLMQEHGVKPNIVTWNILAAGYARLQKVSAAVNAMRRLEAAGFKADDATLRAFSYLHDKAKAVRMMEDMVEANKQRKLEEEARAQRRHQLHEEDEWLGDGEEEGVDMEHADVDGEGAYYDSTQEGVDHHYHHQHPQQRHEHEPYQPHNQDQEQEQDHEQQQQHEQEEDDDDEANMEKEEEALDYETARHLFRLDPGTVSRKKSSRILRVVKELERVAPVTPQPEFEQWVRIRREGLSATETTTTTTTTTTPTSARMRTRAQ
ncbi:hypothetical protein BD289DRAFT_438499 [Coniella lustricola]|uniref:Pentatricopeptide repeat protein n=1 Tax=Coniella lustricola TaxID=2025994 RepID=A0A2T3A2T0_9PEZI|nr:hypothetical protein BD289DRAFT_438499 [Coniella lustricola]